MIKVGPMQLNQPEPLDPMEPFFTGTQPDGGYWQDAARLSAHDHSGGLLGTPVAVSIPDGSITAADLDPSVLAPYALTDGSTPFTGQVTLQADAVVRDALFFGQQGTALAPDVTLSRTGAGALRIDAYLGLAATPATWRTDFPALQLGQAGAVNGQAAGGTLQLRGNSYADASTQDRPLVGGQPATRIEVGMASVAVQTAPAVAAGAAQTFTTRAAIGQNGTLSLAPDPGATALLGPGADNFVIRAGSNNLYFGAPGGIVGPATDNSTNSGQPAARWATVYAVAGAINTSAAEMKQAITPLDPALAMAAVRATEPVTFTYRAPAPPPARQQAYRRPAGVRFDWRAERDRLVARPLEAAARQQAGFVAETAHPLFVTGAGQTNAANTAGIYLGALHDLDARVAALEGAA